ncbi:DUF5666 domain-containing protein [Marinomonas balearica]|uniref:DUF5666 domain-containing protein n=1 Tax=Marinomonas balearica TaxID=491947 RepID=A0A4R6M3C3_9GAMM|nr:DUF5666 domain-containing protein [Marinomonas balearica]TDO95733.1 hypothetical protein DFP79_3087 [Marinomonas balearica]
MLKRFKLLLIAISLSLLVGASDDRGIGGTGKTMTDDRGLGGTGKTMTDDRGLGGTGLADDRGLGGTGIIGTITEFGSIWVNGIEIELNSDTLISIDGKRAKERELRLGQQVAVLSYKKGDIWFAKEVQIEHVLLGEVEQVANDSVTILGETVLKDPEAPGDWPNMSIGDKVAVSGYFFNGQFYSTDVTKKAQLTENWKLTSIAYNDSVGILKLANKRLPSRIGIQAGDKVTITPNGIEKVSRQKVFGQSAKHYFVEYRKPTRDNNDTEINVHPERPNQRDLEVLSDHSLRPNTKNHTPPAHSPSPSRKPEQPKEHQSQKNKSSDNHRRSSQKENSRENRKGNNDKHHRGDRHNRKNH